MHTNLIMSNNLTDKLNHILPLITSKEFLEGKGLGNEIAFYIFDYPPEEETKIREHIQFLVDKMQSQHKLKVLYINLFKFVIEYLDERKILKDAFEYESTKGTDGLMKALKAPLKAENLVNFMQKHFQPSEYDVVFMSGVGNVFPLVRSHTLLSNLQSVMDKTPLVLFYPGKYDGQTLKLFGKLKSKNYYRAFRLIP